MKLLYYIKIGMMIALMLAGAAVAMNQTLNFVYHSHVLKAPCDLCVEVNPQFKDCFFVRTPIVQHSINWSNLNLTK